MRVLVVGGGLIGLGIAWEATLRGLDVTVVNRPTPHAASEVGAGLLIPAGGRISPPHLALRTASADLFPSWVKKLEDASGLPCGFNPCGTLTVAFEPGAHDSVTGLANCIEGLGITVKRLTAEQCLEAEPNLSSEVAAGFLTADHQVDPELLAKALRHALAESGATQLQGEVVTLNPSEAELDDGTTITADKVVVATGSWITDHLALPVFPVKGEVIHLLGDPNLLRHNLVLRREELYIANRGDGRYVVGSTEEVVGFNIETTATDFLREKAERLVPGLKDCEVTDSRVGFRPKIGDGLPVLGDYRGVVVAGAHYRNGILLTPITSRLIGDFLVDGSISPLMKPFTPDRDYRHRDEKTR